MSRAGTRLRAVTVVLAALAVATMPAPGSASAWAPGSSVAAQTSVVLPLHSFTGIVADPVAGGAVIAGSGGVLLVDATGAIRAQRRLPGVGAATLSADGSAIDVVTSGPTVTELDPGTLRTTRTLSLRRRNTCVADLAESAGSIWFSWGPCRSPFYPYVEHLGRVLPDGSRRPVWVTEGPYEMFGPQLLAAAPAAAGKLVVADTGFSPARGFIADVSSGRLRPLHSLAPAVGGGQVVSNTQDIRWTADGKTVLAAWGAPYDFFGMSGTTGAGTGVFPADAYPTAVAGDSTGLLNAGMIGGTVRVYATPLGGLHAPGLRFPLPNGWAAPRGLTFGSAHELYAVTTPQPYGQGTPTVTILTTADTQGP